MEIRAYGIEICNLVTSKLFLGTKWVTILGFSLICKSIKAKINFLLFVITELLNCKCLTFLYYIYLNYLNEARFRLKRFILSVQGSSPVSRLVMRKSELRPVNNMLQVISILSQYINKKD